MGHPVCLFAKEESGVSPSFRKRTNLALLQVGGKSPFPEAPAEQMFQRLGQVLASKSHSLGAARNPIWARDLVFKFESFPSLRYVGLCDLQALRPVDIFVWNVL